MTTSTKSIVALIGAVVIGLAIYGAYQYPKVVQVAGSSTGSTFSTAKVAEITMAPISASATSSALLNTDASDRIVDSSFVSCATSTGSVMAQTSAGVATFNWLISTSSSASLAVLANTNYVANLVLGTSTTDNSYVASSTSPAAVRNRLWPTGTYLNITANATSSNQTLSCQVGVYYHAS